MTGADPKVGLEGDWYYNEGLSSYKVCAASPGKLRYYQVLGSGRLLEGNLQDAGVPPPWVLRADLNNGAAIRLRPDGGRLLSIYRKPGEEDWQPPRVAVRWSGGEWPAAATAETAVGVVVDHALVGASEPGALSGGNGQPAEFHWQPVASLVRETVLGSFHAQSGLAPLTPACSVMQAIAEAVPVAHKSPMRLSDRLPLVPLSASIPPEAIAEAKRRRAERAASAKPDPKTTITPVPAVHLGFTLEHPVSYNEEQMFRLFIGDPRNMGYNLAHTARSHVPLDVDSARWVHELIIERHTVLRSAYRQDTPTSQVRVIAPRLHGGVQTYVVPGAGDDDLVNLMDRASPHQLGVTGIRCSVISKHLGDDHPTLGVNLHHILADADGLGLYGQEAAMIQLMLAAGYPRHAIREAMPTLPVSFIDFTYWQKSLEASGGLDSDLAYWHNQVVASTPPVVLDIPIDRPRPKVWMATGATERCLYDNELLTPMAEVVGRATPMAVATTNFGIVLSRWSGCPVLDVAVPFALRNMPVLTGLIGNFLNMMPVRIRHDPDEPYCDMLERVATSNINVQKHSLSQFIQLVESTRQHYPVADPSRNPVYATMVDLVPNDSDTPSGALSGVLDIFLFINTREGVIWSIDAVYNTTILEAQTVRVMLLQMQAIARHAARSAREPIPRSLACCEEAQPIDSAQVNLANVTMQVGLLPHVVPVSSGWPGEGASLPEYFGVRRSRRFKRHGGLELGADFPPDTSASVPPPRALAPAAKPKPKPRPPRASGDSPTRAAEAHRGGGRLTHKAVKALDRQSSPQRGAPGRAGTGVPQWQGKMQSLRVSRGAGGVAQRSAPRSGMDRQISEGSVAAGTDRHPRFVGDGANGLALDRPAPRTAAEEQGRRRDVAVRWAETKRASELISLDEGFDDVPLFSKAASGYEPSDAELLMNGRMRRGHRTGQP